MRDCHGPETLQFKAGLKPIGGIDRLAVRGYGRGERLQEVEDIAAEIQQICWPGCSDSVLKTTLRPTARAQGVAARSSISSDPRGDAQAGQRVAAHGFVFLVFGQLGMEREAGIREDAHRDAARLPV